MSHNKKQTTGVDQNNLPLVNVPDPSNNQDAATKAYVDEHASSGDVIGPANSTDDAIAVFDGITGKLLKNSGVKTGLDGFGYGYLSNVSGPGGSLTGFPYAVFSVPGGDPNGEESVLIDEGFLTVGSAVITNTVQEKTAGFGVIVEDVPLKDGKVDGRDVAADGTRLDAITDASYKNSNVTTITGNAGTATILQTSRTVRTNLGSTATASFNGSANITPGVTGTLPISNGGTGATSTATALSNLGGIGASTTATLTNKTIDTASNTIVRQYCKVYQSSTQNVSTNTLTAMQYNTELTDPSGWFDSATSTTNISPSSGGGYWVIAQCELALSFNNDQFHLKVYVNGSPTTPAVETVTSYRNTSTGGASQTIQASGLVILPSSQSISAYVKHNHGGDRPVVGSLTVIKL
ncbi:MAG: hypothetical protein WA991_04010 [Ornithinimicrobium sp.]